VSFTRVSKAIIPAAGKGSRVRSVAGDLPKELLMVAAKPLIVHSIEALAASGVREIAIVISPEKENIRQFILEDQHQFVGPRVEAHTKILFRSCKFSFFVQHQPVGIADAVSLCRDFVGNEPFALIFPDNVLLDGLPVVAQMLPFFTRFGMDTIGALWLTPEETTTFGNVGFLEVEPMTAESRRVMRVLSYSDKLPERPPAESAKDRLKSFGGGIYLPHFFDYVERIRPLAEGEVDDVPVVQAIAREKGLLAVELSGKGFDVGNPAGYWAANLYAESGHPHGQS